VALEVQLNERLEQDLQLGYTRIGNHRADIHVHWRSNDVSETTSDDGKDANSNSTANTDLNTKLPILKEQAANVLSRGEKKLLITALRLSQLPLLLNDEKPPLAIGKDGNSDTVLNSHTKSRATPVVLLDDITAELDDRAIDILLSTLAQLPCQVFMTSLTEDILPLVHEYWSEPKMFHVKQGSLTVL
jgi:DNA replication and repair protein RecF